MTHSVLEEFPEPIIIVDLEQNVLFANRLAKNNLFWKDKKDLKCFEILYNLDKPCYSLGYKCKNCFLNHNTQDTNNLEREIDYKINITPLKDKNNNTFAYLKVIHNKSLKQQEKERLWYLANYDFLTGLPNRILLLDRLEQAINRSIRNKKEFALMFLDLDGFKAVNDLYGHDTGDILLKLVSKRVQSSIRKIDTLARYGGDEFVIIIEEISNNKDVISIANDILKNIKKSFKIDDKLSVNINCSIGICIFNLNKSSLSKEEIIKKADYAMYEAKRLGKARYKFHKD